jgi:glycosyltransferase involved in cell wall biosynthesis
MNKYNLDHGDRSVALVVCGKFHYLDFAKHLLESGKLTQFIFSHRRASSRMFNSISGVSNLYFKEYLYQGHTKVLGGVGLGYCEAFYHHIWQYQLFRTLRPSTLLHFLLHGNCTKAVRKAKRQGSYILADAVNAHSDEYFKLVEEEYASLGMRPPLNNSRLQDDRNEEMTMADSFLVPSRYVFESFVRSGVPAGRIMRIPYGTDVSRFHPALERLAPPRNGPFRVICSSMVIALKGHQYLLRAWKQLALPNAELHCYGYIQPGIMEPLLRIGASNVHFHNWVNRDILTVALQQADAFVMPTVVDGFGLVILEAMACALPVIATENSGGPDVLSNGRTGFVVPIRSPDAIAEKIEWLYHHREAAGEMGRAARLHVESFCSWQEYARQMGAYYEECLSSRK